MRGWAAPPAIRSPGVLAPYVSACAARVLLFLGTKEQLFRKGCSSREDGILVLPQAGILLGYRQRRLRMEVLCGTVFTCADILELPRLATTVFQRFRKIKAIFLALKH